MEGRTRLTRTSHNGPHYERSVDPDIAGHHYAAGDNERGEVPTQAMGRRAPVASTYNSSFIGISPVMQALYEQITRAAKSQAPVFIMGETGTGKEVCAETIHRHSTRHDKPFIAINCAAIPRDLLESELFGHVKGAFTGAISDREGAAALADGGTLFLDEVAEMAPDMQTKLLRFLQNFSFRKVGGNTLETTDVRIVCATNRDPLAEIQAGHLREDLFFRLHVIPLQIPPLHKRGDDVLDIAYALLRRYSCEEKKRLIDFNSDVCDFFRAYSWPGNVRQLQNVIRYICVMHDSETVSMDMLPRIMLHEEPQPSCNSGHINSQIDGNGLPDVMEDMTLADIERHVIENTVRRMDGNVPLAAAHLGVAPSTLYRKRLSWEVPELLENPQIRPGN